MSVSDVVQVPEASHMAFILVLGRHLLHGQRALLRLTKAHVEAKRHEERQASNVSLGASESTKLYLVGGWATPLKNISQLGWLATQH